MLPMGMSCSFLMALATVAASSGRLVPTATRVSPMTRWLTPSARAMSTAPETTIYKLSSPVMLLLYGQPLAS